MSVSEETSAAPYRRKPTSKETTRAIIFMLAGFFCYSTSDMLAKVLSQSVNPLQIAWLRQLGLLSGVIVMLAWKGPHILRSRFPLLQVCRGLTVVVAATSFLFAIAYVPLADATAVSFVAPFIVIVLAGLLLGEAIGLKRWIAVMLGFTGTMIIIRPGFNALHPAIFLVLLSGAAFGIRQIISRRVSGSDPLVTTVAYTALTAAILLSLPLPFIWTNPADLQHLLMMVGISIIAGSGELSIMRALDLGEAVVLSPLQYTLIIWSTCWGFSIFAHLPDMWTLIGTAIIVASGIYSLYHETRPPHKTAGVRAHPGKPRLPGNTR